MNKKKNVLVIAAHPDDEVLGCGGTIAKYKNKFNFHCLFLSDGVSSRSLEQKKNDLQIKKRKISAEKACKILGIKKIFFGNFPDNSMDSVPFLSIVKYIETYIKLINPFRIYTHFGNDLNIDHHLVSRAVITATRPQKKKTVSEILFFEIPSSTEWNFRNAKHLFNPNVFENIEKTINVKKKALNAYKQELRGYPHPRSLKAIVNLSKYRGTTSSSKFAEAFVLARQINV